jgi:hypothetical protein
MWLRLVRFVSLLLTALTLGLTGCHVLEIWGKLRLDAGAWIIVQQNLYAAFGVAGAVIELGAIGTSWLLVLLVRGRHPAFRWTLAGALLVTLCLGSWFLLVAPVNEIIAALDPAGLPEGWRAIRTRWELGHAAGAVLAAAAFSALLVAILSETPERLDRLRPPRRHWHWSAR